MRDCVKQVERDELFSLPENQRGDSELEHGDLGNRETVQGALKRADEGALDKDKKKQGERFTEIQKE